MSMSDSGVPYGMNSPQGKAEWDEFLRRRRQVYADIMEQLGMATQLQGMSGGMAPPGPTLEMAQQIQAQQGNGYLQRRLEEVTAPIDEREHRNLLGAADFYEIDDADQMPREQLKQLVNERREYLASQRGESFPEVAYDTFVQSVGILGLGSVQGVVDGLKHVPFLGDAIRKSEGVARYQRGLEMLLEGLTGDIAQVGREDLGDIKRVAEFVGYGALTGVAAEGVIASGFAGGIANPLIRGSLQGVGTGWLLEGGGDESLGERAANIAIIGALQGGGTFAAERLIPGLARRLQVWRQRGIPEAREGVNGLDDIVDADWAFEQPQGLLPGPQRVPPGVVPEEAALVEVGLLPTRGTQLQVRAELPPSGMPPGTFQVAPGTTSFPRGQQLPSTVSTPSVTIPLVRYGGQLHGRPHGLYASFGGQPSAHASEGRAVPFTYMGRPPLDLSEGAWVDYRVRGYPAAPASAGVEAIRHLAGQQALDELLNAPLDALQQRLASEGLNIDLPFANEFGNRKHLLEVLGANMARRAGYQGLQLRDPVSPEFDEFVVLDDSAIRTSESSRPSPLAEATALTKQGTLLESPALPELSRMPLIDDAEVALAAVRTNPGQVSVIQNVGDVGKTVRRFLQDYLPNGVGPQDFRVVRRRVERVIGAELQRGSETGVISRNSRQDEMDWRLTRFETNEQGQVVGNLYEEWPSFDEATKMAEMLDFSVQKRVVSTDYFDILVSDGTAITQRMVKDYEEFGMFQGMKATTAQGAEVTVVALGPEISTVRGLGGNEYRVHTAQLAAGKTSGLSQAAPESYLRMKGFALSRMAHEAGASGLPLDKVDWFSDELTTQLPRYIDEFLDMMGVQGQGARGTFTSLFTEGRLADFKTLAPETFAKAEEVGRMASRAELSLFAEGYTPTVGEIASTKGLLWEPRPAGAGILRDAFSGNAVQEVSGLEEAFQFLQHFNRTIPDLSPLTTVPVELATSIPGAINPGASEAPDFRGGMARLADDGEAEMRLISRLLDEADLIDMGGGGIYPPGGGGGLDAGGNYLPPAGGSSAPLTPGEEFQRLRETSYGRFRRLETQFSNALNRAIEPMRGYAARSTELMNQAGVRANYWDDVTDVQNRMGVAYNELEGLERQLERTLSKIRSRKLRDGTSMAIGEMTPGAAEAAMRNAGYTAREMEGQRELRAFLEQVGDAYGVRHILDYMPHIRAANSPENAAEQILRFDFSGPGRWFASMVRQGAIEYREMNVTTVMHKWLRGAVFSRHVAPSVESMTQRWVQDSRVPESLREISSNWLSLVTTGYTPGGSRIGEGIAAVMQNVGIPLTARDVQGLIRWSMANVYRGWLGWRPDVMLREILNPLLASSRVGNFAELGRTLREFSRDEGYRQAAVARGLRGGWVLRSPLGSTAQEMFRASDASFSSEHFPVPENEFGPLQNMVREGFARAGDVVRDVRAVVTPGGYSNSVLDPMKPLDKINELGRLLSGESAYRSFMGALEEYTRGLSEPGAELVMRDLQGKLLMESGAANFHESLQRAVIQLVRDGDYEGAAFKFANEAANQLGRLGQLDQPPMLHTMGAPGRIGTMLGNFTIQFQSNMREGLMNSGLAQEFGGAAVYSRARAGTRFLANHALIYAALGAAGSYGAWNFGKWVWFNALGWGGGPMAWALLDGIRASSAKFKQMNDQKLTPQETVSLNAGSEIGRILQPVVNPFMGGMRTLEGTAAALQSGTPLESTAQFWITGQRGQNAAEARSFDDPHSLLTPWESQWGPPLSQRPQQGGGYPSPPGSGAMP
jgi:hypothetical protein